MSRHLLATAGACLALGVTVPFGASADSRCARGADEFCLGSTTSASPAREARGKGWANWASGSRMRLGGPLARGAVEADEPDAAPVPVVPIALPAAGLGTRLQPGAAYGASLQTPDPETAIYGSYPLGESFSLDMTAARGRIGLRGLASDPAYAAAPGVGFSTGSAIDRTAWSVSLNAARQIGAFGIGGRIGYVDVRDQPELLFDAGGPTLGGLGAERATSLRRSFLGVDASYDIGRNWQLHGGAMYRRDEGRANPMFSSLGTLHAAGDEKEWGVGVRYYGWRNFKLNVEYLKTSGREQFGNEALLFLGRFDF